MHIQQVREESYQGMMALRKTGFLSRLMNAMLALTRLMVGIMGV